MNLIPVKWERQITDSQYLSLLLNPQFVKVEGVIVIQAHYNPQTFFENWTPIIRKHPDKIEQIENTLNHVHLGSFTEDVNLQESIGKHIRDIWSKELETQIPDFQFEMPLSHVSDEWELGLWTKKK
jgi:hypothetical protein